MKIFHTYIQDDAHYTEVLKRIGSVHSTLWIGTADIKDLFVKYGRGARPFLGELAGLIDRGIQVRLIHAKEPGPNFRADFDRYPVLQQALERVLCPRVHFKMILMDLHTAYIGSANLTGAGMGMKGSGKRNFEAGLLTNDPDIVAAAVRQFDSIWIGEPCAACQRQAFCGDRIDD